MKGRGILHDIEEHSVGFSLTFIALFTITFVFLLLVDVVPDPGATWRERHGGTPLSSESGANISAENTEGEMPSRIIIDSILLDVAVTNPSSTDIHILDRALLSGAVRYPTSGLLGQNGTVLLFGHSSYLPVVRNQSYKAFDGIQNLRTGNSISVYSSTAEYRYRVVGVRLANAQDSDENTIELRTDGKYLVLVTCDSFGTKSDRYIVTAEFVGTYSLTR